MSTPELATKIHWRSETLMTVSQDQRELDGLRDLDSQVITAVYDRYFLDVYRYARYRIGDEQAAEDITSDVFVRLLEATQRGRGPQTNLKAWLLGTASHIVTDHLRRAYRRPVQDISDNLFDPLAHPHAEIEHRENESAIRNAMKKLTPEQQHVLALRFGEGYSIEETAAVMNKNINAVKALQFRALASLQRRMEEVAHE